jgi:hypothetical protein
MRGPPYYVTVIGDLIKNLLVTVLIFFPKRSLTKLGAYLIGNSPMISSSSSVLRNPFREVVAKALNIGNRRIVHLAKVDNLFSYIGFCLPPYSYPVPTVDKALSSQSPSSTVRNASQEEGAKAGVMWLDGWPSLQLPQFPSEYCCQAIA